MAEPRTCRSSCHNPPLGNEDELAEGPLGASTKGSNTLTFFPAISQTPTPALLSTNELFKRFMKAYLECN